jgi:hypothetical protein
MSWQRIGDEPFRKTRIVASRCRCRELAHISFFPKTSRRGQANHGGRQ